MSTIYTLTVTAGDGVTPVTTSARTTAINLKNTFDALAGGNKTVAYTVATRTSGAYASGTVTCASAAENDTVTLGGVVFTAVNGTPTGDQFDMSLATDTLVAADLVRAYNASTTDGAAGCATASNLAGVVTFTASTPGKIGNAITLASSNGTRLEVSGARLADGAETLTTFTY